MAGTGAASARQNRLAPYLLIAPGILWLLVFFVVPLVALAQTSVASSGEPWWDGYVRALGTYGTHFLRSFRYAAHRDPAVAPAGLSAGIRHRVPGRAAQEPAARAWSSFRSSPPSWSARFAWKTILSDGGPAVWLLSRPPPALGGRPAARYHAGRDRRADLQLSAVHDPADLRRASRRSIRRLVEAAHDLYSTPLGAFRRVVLPLSLPGVFAGSLLTFIPASGDFINAELLGSPNQQMIGTVIQNQFLEVRDFSARGGALLRPDGDHHARCHRLHQGPRHRGAALMPRGRPSWGPDPRRIRDAGAGLSVPADPGDRRCTASTSRRESSTSSGNRSPSTPGRTRSATRRWWMRWC